MFADTRGARRRCARITRTAVLALAAVLARTAQGREVYVSPQGDDETGSPFRTVSAALASIAGEDGGVVHIADGEYEEAGVYRDAEKKYYYANILAVTNGIRIVGDSGASARVTIRRVSGDVRLLYMNHPDAAVENVTLTGGHLNSSMAQDWSGGGNVYIGEKGGTLSNCTVVNGYLDNRYAAGGNIYMQAGRVTHCVVTQGHCNYYIYEGAISGRDGAAGIDAAGGIIDNTLVVSNAWKLQTWDTDAKLNQYGYAPVTLRNNAKMVNCTVAWNNGLGTGGIYCKDRARAVNCAIFGNAVGSECTNDVATAVAFLGDPSAFVHCATDGVDIGGEGCVSGDVRVDATGRPTTAHAVLVDAGTDDADAGPLDLDFSPRVSNGAIDIGAYELQQGEALDLDLADVSRSHKDAPSEVVFQVKTYGLDEGVLYSWDFDGDGAWDRQGYEERAAWTYRTDGTFDVRVRAVHAATGRVGEATLPVTILPHRFRGFVVSIRGPKPIDLSHWKIRALDPTHIVVQFDCRTKERAAFALTKEEASLDGWKFDIALTNASTRARAYRAALEETLRDGAVTVSGRGVKEHGFWIHPLGQTAYPVNGREYPIAQGDLMYTVYLTLDEPMAEGVENSLSLADGTQLRFKYDASVPSPLFKVNQVGYSARAPERYAYVGQWLGSLGAYPAPEGRAFELVDADTGEAVFTGTLVKRSDVSDYEVGEGSTYFLQTGEETVEADFSAFSTPGTYYIRVPGIGRSIDFRISDDAIADQFAVHMLGLYHQRCGCAKTEPLTHWTDDACHRRVWRGVHSPNDWEYASCYTVDGQSITNFNKAHDHFTVISRNLAACTNAAPPLALPGGWHDAADYDRRPYHLSIVGDLAAVYMMKPENFTDAQLAVPERGNGIPDILDEADWGLRHIVAAQQADGGTGTWIETTRHPDGHDQKMASEDSLLYFLSLATRNSSLEYAGYAAMLARAMKMAGGEAARARHDVYKESAIRAWRFGNQERLAPTNVLTQGTVEIDGTNATVILTAAYQEPESLNAYYYAKAALNLAFLTGDESYLAKCDEAFRRDLLYSYMNKDDYRWGGLYFIETWIPPDAGCESVMTNAFVQYVKEQYRTRVSNSKCNLLEDGMRNAIPYRPCWFNPSRYWAKFKGPGWGQIIPMRNALAYCAMHYMTGDDKYLAGAFLASDFQCGCNPRGSTWTAGLGKAYPVRYLSLQSLADGIEEYVSGITPYQSLMDYSWNLKRDPRFTPDWYRERIQTIPFWRRWENLEAYTVAISEFAVSETIGPSAAAAGYLMNAAAKPNLDWPRPASKLTDLPGYWLLP